MHFDRLGHTGVIGLQWGDEGKGKIVDLLTEHFDVVVRCAGGANAGHTVRHGDQSYALHLLPSGILRPGVMNIIGPGVVVDLKVLVGEIRGLRERGIEIGDNLKISDRAHLVMPWHQRQDRLSESGSSDEKKIGTTAKGIGPCYADKMLRTWAIRVCDLRDADAFRRRVEEIFKLKGALFGAMYGDDLSDWGSAEATQFIDEALTFAEMLAPHVVDTTPLLHRYLSDDSKVLFEGAQGSMLDVNHGTYPFVTSSACVAGGMAVGAGVGPSVIENVLGVVKAYSTRVGGGPFPTEQDNPTGDRIREVGHEYGTTTGRPRRCGWFDAAAVRYAIQLSGVTEVAVMHLDTLGALDEIKVCTGYRLNGAEIDGVPARADDLAAIEPLYESLASWGTLSAGIERYEQLPAAARQYVERLEALLGVPVTLVSIGPERSATLHRGAFELSGQA